MFCLSQVTEIPSGTQTMRQWVVLYFSLVPRTRTTVKASYRPIKFRLHAWYMRKATITAFSLLLAHPHPPPRPERKRRKTAAWRCIMQHPCHAFPILFIVNKSNKKQSAYFISTTQLGTQCWYLGALVSQAAVLYI